MLYRIKSHNVCRLLCTAVLFVSLSLPLVGFADAFWSSSEAMKYAVGKNGVWIVEGDKVSFVSLSDQTSTTVGNIEYITRITAEQDYLIFLTQEVGEQTISLMSIDGSILHQTALPDGFVVYQIEATTEMVYILGDFNYEEAVHGHIQHNTGIVVYQLSLYIPDSLQRLQINGWNNEYITAIAVYDHLLYAYSGITLEACVIDLETNMLVCPPVAVTNLAYIASAGDVDGIPYMYALSTANPAELWLVNLQTGEKGLVDTDIPNGCYGLRRSRSLLFTLNSDGKTLESIPMDTVTSAETITIVNSLRTDTKRMRTAMELFQIRYPDIDIEFQWVDDPRVLSTGIMSGVEGYDLISVQEYASVTCSPQMYKVGAIENLNDYPEITAMLPEFLDMFGPVSINGHLFGVPEMVFPYLWEIDYDVADKLGLSLPSTYWTWSDFFEIAQIVSEYNRRNDEPIIVLHDSAFILPYFLIQYNANVVDIMAGRAVYHVPEFVELLSMWQTVWREGLISDSPSVPDNVLFTSCRTDYYGMGHRTLILPPRFNETTKYPVEMVSLVMNANTPNKEAASYFLACYLSPEALLSESIDSQGQWLADSNRYSRFDIDISTENEELWRQILTNSTLDYYIGDLYRDQWQTLYPQLLAGEITPEEFSLICQRRANMVLGE